MLINLLTVAFMRYTLYLTLDVFLGDPPPLLSDILIRILTLGLFASPCMIRRFATQSVQTLHKFAY